MKTRNAGISRNMPEYQGIFQNMAKYHVSVLYHNNSLRCGGTVSIFRSFKSNKNRTQNRDKMTNGKEIFSAASESEFKCRYCVHSEKSSVVF